MNFREILFVEKKHNIKKVKAFVRLLASTKEFENFLNYTQYTKKEWVAVKLSLTHRQHLQG